MGAADVLSRAEFVEAAAQLVDIAGIKAPPVNPALLARCQGIHRVILCHDLPVSGQLVRIRDELIIKLNAKESIQRRSFSLCHEIAHSFVLDGSSQKCRIAGAEAICFESSREECLCDLAAAEMLMPRRFFEPLAMKMEPSISSVVELAKQFGTSISATAARFGQISAWPVVFIVWKWTRRLGASARLRVSWCVRPPGARCFVPKHAAAEAGSSMCVAFEMAHPTVDTEMLDLGSLRGRYLIESARFGDQLLSVVHGVKLQRRV